MPTAKKSAAKTTAKKKTPLKKASGTPLTELKKELIEHTDAFCKDLLNEEYRDMCRVMAKGLCVEDSPAFAGDTRTWAAAIVATVGYVNFLDDASFKPYISQTDLAKKLDIPKAVLNKHRKVLIDGFDLIPFDPDFTLPSMIPMNPLITLASSPTLLEGCCQAGSCSDSESGCCENGNCSMEGCDRVDCCQLDAKPKKSKTKTKKK